VCSSDLDHSIGSQADDRSSTHCLSLKAAEWRWSPANQGIGFTLAQALALDGLRVVVNGQRAEAVSAAVSTMREAGADASGITGNVADESAVNRMF